MKKNLRLIAVILFGGSIVYWAAAGANRGWTKTRVPIKTTDTVTGLEGIQWQDKFVPGVDFLGAAALGAGVLAGLSLFVPPKSKPPTIETKS
jgi:hypothetical protein